MNRKCICIAIIKAAVLLKYTFFYNIMNVLYYVGSS